jgi:hypothetical protein
LFFKSDSDQKRRSGRKKCEAGLEGSWERKEKEKERQRKVG